MNPKMAVSKEVILKEVILEDNVLVKSTLEVARIVSNDKRLILRGMICKSIPGHTYAGKWKRNIVGQEPRTNYLSASWPK